MRKRAERATPLQEQARRCVLRQRQISERQSSFRAGIRAVFHETDDVPVPVGASSFAAGVGANRPILGFTSRAARPAKMRPARERGPLPARVEPPGARRDRGAPPPAGAPREAAESGRSIFRASAAPAAPSPGSSEDSGDEDLLPPVGCAALAVGGGSDSFSDG
jgi:hypothetical protein